MVSSLPWKLALTVFPLMEEWGLNIYKLFGMMLVVHLLSFLKDTIIL